MTKVPAVPAETAGEWRAADGARLWIRSIRPDDAALEQAFVRGLSAQSRHLRFMDAIRELSPLQLTRFTRIDLEREVAMVALQRREDGVEEQVAVARFVTLPDGEHCEFALAVADAWQRRGLGRHLMTQLVDLAVQRGLRTMTGEVLAGNDGMLALARSLGFAIEAVPGDPGARRVILTLGRHPA